MFPVWYVYMVLVDSGLMTSLMTSSRNNLCHNFWAKYLGNEARLRDGSNGQPIGKCPCESENDGNDKII